MDFPPEMPVNPATPGPIGDIQVKNHPFPVLLYLEWGLSLLGILSILLMPSPLIRAAHSYTGLICGLTLVFCLMGLRLPVNNLRAILHTAIAFVLIIAITFLGMQNRLFPFLHLYPFLYIILVIRSCLMFPFRGRLIITLTSFLLFFGILFRRIRHSNWVEILSDRVPLSYRDRFQERLEQLNLGFALTAIMLLGLALLFIFLLVNAILSERQSRERVAIANQQLRQYALRIETLAMEQERARIARDIHDALGHSLTALNLQLEGTLKLWQSNPEQAHRFLHEAKSMGSTALQEVRQSVAAMRTDPLQGKGLEEAIALLIQDFQRRTSIQINYHIEVPSFLPQDVTLNLYRIVQESLTNMSKHANATQVNLQIETTAIALVLTVTDNGRGFDWTKNQTGFGLQGMRERVSALGGELTIASQPGQGCQIRAQLPR
jgi:signal transduction histidine kinase